MSDGMSNITGIDPYGFYDQIRANDGLVWDAAMKGWLVASYDDCKMVEMEEHRFRHPYSDADQTLIDIKGGRRNITILQGPEQASMHRFLLRLFAPKNIQHYREHHIKPIINELIGRFVDDGRTELVHSFSSLIPSRVIMSLSAMDWRDDDLARRLFSLHDTVMRWIGNGNSGVEETAAASRAAHEITDILLPYLNLRKEEPGDDLLSRVWTEGPAILENFSDADVLATTRELFLAGTDTTVHALGNALYLLLTQPETLARIEQDRSALPTFIEEALRVYGSVQYRFRLVNEDCEVGGTQVKKDDVLILINAAANRDPKRYECPAHVRLDRKNPKDHLAFNAGPRTCVGAALARAEMYDAIDLLLDNVTNLRLDPDAPPPSFHDHYTRSFRPLHVLFDRK
ncbi:Cytochrome P450 [Sphingobium faniae]|nr:Cytochrome P450 [Sphingobium faniae]